MLLMIYISGLMRTCLRFKCMDDENKSRKEFFEFMKFFNTYADSKCFLLLQCMLANISKQLLGFFKVRGGVNNFLNAKIFGFVFFLFDPTFLDTTLLNLHFILNGRRQM